MELLDKMTNEAPVQEEGHYTKMIIVIYMCVFIDMRSAHN